jgi:hypothetical protein
MKDLELKQGKEIVKIKVCETIEDINIKRFMAMKEWMIYKESGMELPSLKKTYIDIVRAFDDNSPSRILLKLHEQVQGLTFIENGKDPNQMMFSLMCIEEGEDETNTDHQQLMDKMDRLAKMGLNQGVVLSETENFTQALFE